MRDKISAIIACYNDAPAVPVMYDRLRKVFEMIGVEYEIIFVNDGSPDNAESVLKRLADNDPNVCVINHSRNFGNQMAFLSGMEVATGDAVVLLDGDLQDPPELIESFYEKWREGFEVVYGIAEKREAGLLMGLAYTCFYRVFNRLSYIPVPVDAGDFSLLDRRVVDVIRSMPERDVFLRGLRAWTGFRQVGVPYERPKRIFGKSTNNLYKNIWWARKGIFSFSYLPLELISYCALGVVFASFIGIFIQVGIRLFFPERAPHGFSTLIVLILFMGGLQLLSIAIVGEYLGRIFEEVKRRPKFIVKDILNSPLREKKRPSTNEEKAEL